MAEPILLTHWQSPGDITCMTAAVRDLALTYPGRFEIHVAGACSDLWESNPYIAKFWGDRFPASVRRISLSYKQAMTLANEVKLHVLTAFHRNLEEILSLQLDPLRPFGDLHLSQIERSGRLVEGRYWLFISGGKTNTRTKLWPLTHSQGLVDRLRQCGIEIVQAGAIFPGHEHLRLKNVIDMVGRTNLREFLRLIFHADGVICPVTFAMHAAAAFEKPCVVIAGGREPWWWEAYVNSPERHFGPRCSSIRVQHRFIPSQVELDCCRLGGCWKTSMPNSNDLEPHDCVLPMPVGQGTAVPACLASISPELVAEAVLSYYRDNTLASL